LKPDAKLRSCAGDILDIISNGSIPLIQIYYLDQVKLHRIGEINLDDQKVFLSVVHTNRAAQSGNAPYPFLARSGKYAVRSEGVREQNCRRVEAAGHQRQEFGSET
jgi:hypothetical protein